MTASDPTRKLAAVLKKLRAQHPEVKPPAATATGVHEGPDALVEELIFSFMLWDATSAQARAAHRRLRESLVDYNELRVCFSDELAAMMGERYPRAEERALRLRATLNDLYKREHGVSLGHLSGAAKRESRTYLESLEGIPQFVAARLVLLHLGGHAIPTDERIFGLLQSEGAAPTDIGPDDLAGWLERHVRAGEGMECHALLQAWSDEGPARKKPESKPADEPAKPAKGKGRRKSAKPG